uniref:Ras-related protein Rab-21 n=1 Tax=Panagrolaimus sp. PS1159 TaxID=55785 RepID=A0AC35EXJ7_9BILA
MDDNAGTSDLSSFKVVLLGEGAVGKSSVLLRYIENKFNNKHLSTTQASFATRKLNIDGKDVELNIWDTAGQEKYHSLGPIYYRGSQGAILVYDITDERSFERIKNWVRELQEVLKGSAALFVVGNKIDLEETRTISKETALQYAESVNANYHECSAKENINIDSLFDNIAKVMLEREKDAAINLSRRPSLRRSNSRRTLQVIDDDEAAARPRKKCC